MSENKKINSSKRTFLNMLLCIFALGMIISGGVAGGTYVKMYLEANAFARIAEVDVSEDEILGIEVDVKDQEEARAFRQRIAKCKRLAAENEDFRGWLKIDDTKIDYPVMAREGDSQYYLHRDFQGKYSFGGTPFLGDACDEDSQSIIVYAHHMNNGTMFGELEKFEKQEYRDEHPVIHFDTVREARDYEVVAAFRTRLLYDNEEGFRYYEFTGDLDEEQLAEFEKGVSAINAYGEMPKLDKDGKYIMLSTCAYHARYGRFVVLGKLMEK